MRGVVWNGFGGALPPFPRATLYSAVPHGAAIRVSALAGDDRCAGTSGATGGQEHRLAY